MYVETAQAVRILLQLQHRLPELGINVQAELLSAMDLKAPAAPSEALVQPLGMNLPAVEPDNEPTAWLEVAAVRSAIIILHDCD